MKCIAYVSRPPIIERDLRLPTDISGIVKASKRFNSEAHITGIILYRQGQYFQVLEGPDRVLDTLMSKILIDTRHEDIWVFTDLPIVERDFSRWEVNIFDFINKGPEFSQFVENNRQKLNSFTEQQKTRLKPFINLDKEYIENNSIENKNTEDKSVYDGKSLRLLAWPDLNNVRQPKIIIALCVKLTKKPYPFDKLVHEGEFGTHQQLSEIIETFETSGILTITKTEPEPEPTITQKQVPETKKPKSFYGAIKRFLGMG